MSINPGLLAALAATMASGGAAAPAMAGAAGAGEAAAALGATEMAPAALSAAEGTAGFDGMLATLGGGNPELGKLALANMAVQAGSAIAGDNSAIGRVGGTISKGMQGAMIAKTSAIQGDKNRKILDQILSGMTSPGTPGHDEVKVSSDGTYSVKGMLDQSNGVSAPTAPAPTKAPISSAPQADNSQIAMAPSPWVQKILG